MTPSPANLFRALVGVVLGIHVFRMYAAGRTAVGEFGASLTGVTIGALFALAMMLPFVWVYWLPDLPELLARQRGAKRWAAGRCPACGYDLRGGRPAGDAEIDDADACSECGQPARAPTPWRVGPSTAWRFLSLVLLAWSVGSVASEVWIERDEARFVREVETRLRGGRSQPYHRPRAWPTDYGRLEWSPDGGFVATG